MTSPGPMQLVPLREDGTPDIDMLNAEFTPDYLADPAQPALGGQANRRVSLGTNGEVQELPGDDTVTEDSMAVQEGSEAGASDNGAQRKIGLG